MLTLCLTTTEQRLTLDRQKENKFRLILGAQAMDPRSQRRRAGRTRPSFIDQMSAIDQSAKERKGAGANPGNLGQ